MDAPFAARLLGWKKGKSAGIHGPLVPNCADSNNHASIRIASGMLAELGVEAGIASDVPADPGGPLEERVAEYLADRLPVLAAHRTWQVSRGKVISDFAQYAHLRHVDELVREQPALRITLGTDYLIKPDVVVAFQDRPGAPFLHAAVSCKWTIRSDRVQNIRHEFNQMIRHRRGRQPHLIAVTAEPLPTRLAAIARGTGEVDAVYHVAFHALSRSVERNGSAEQRAAWDECVQQNRLLSFAELADSIASY